MFVYAWKPKELNSTIFLAKLWETALCSWVEFTLSHSLTYSSMWVLLYHCCVDRRRRQLRQLCKAFLWHTTARTQLYFTGRGTASIMVGPRRLPLLSACSTCVRIYIYYTHGSMQCSALLLHCTLLRKGATFLLPAYSIFSPVLFYTQSSSFCRIFLAYEIENFCLAIFISYFWIISCLSEIMERDCFSPKKKRFKSSHRFDAKGISKNVLFWKYVAIIFINRSCRLSLVVRLR